MGYLQRLELENFKSYKGKHTIGPFKRFTAIIGPNGCGKSNLMDAISFVFGERTQSLRVRTVKDLIHGAPIGKPVASTGMVTAVYAEEDGTEINFTRKIVGSGTEYRIDSKIVSPQQYTSKLESLGILVKAKNFLVFQGTVESIAMKTPKERTQMFEKISRSGELADDYEKKKVEMQKAEEETSFNYHKKKGIAAEKREAKAEKEEADKYHKLNQELEDCQLEIQLFKLYHNEQSINHLTNELKAKSRDLDKLEKKKSEIDQQLKSKKQENAKFSREMASVEKKITTKEAELNKNRPQYIKAKEKTSHVLKRIETSKKAYDKAKNVHKKHQAEIKELEYELEEVRSAAEKYEEEILGASQDENVELMDSQLEQYNALKEQAGRETAALKLQLDKIVRAQSSEQESLDQLKQKKSDLMAQQKHKTDQRTQLMERIEKLDEYISTNIQTVEKLRQDHDRMEGEINDANSRYMELSQQLDSVQEELNEAKMDKHESARHQKKQELLESMKRLFPGVYGRLIDLCQPVHKKYTFAITKVLGRNMDAIVVDTEKTGKDCIQYLREQRADPEMFLPLDSIQVKPVNEKLRQIGGTAKLVIDVIKYEPAVIKKALQFACANALVCDGMEEARRLAFGGAERKKTVSLDGTLFEKSGVISGGVSEVKAKARRWDEKQVDGLKRKRDSFLVELKDLSKHRRKEPELQNLKSQIDGLEHRLRYSTKDKETTEKQTLGEISKELKVIKKELDTLQPKREKLLLSMAARSEEITNTEKRMNRVEDQVFRGFCEQINVENIRQYEEKQLKAQQERAQRRLEFSNQESRLMNQLEYERGRDTKGQLKKLEESMATDEEEIEKLRGEEKEKLKIIERETSILEKLRLEKSAVKSQIDEKDLEIKEVKKGLMHHMKEVTSLQKQMTAMETQLEQKRADRHSLLKSCKMEDIFLPFKKGGMNDIDLGEPSASQPETSSQESSSTEVNSASTQGAKITYEREANLVIDYSSLSRNLKQLDDPAEIRNMMNELTNKVNKLQTTLQRIQAPNMKALEKLDGVSSRFQETSAEFEQARNKARKAKIEFETVKKSRYDRFMDAFEHVSQRIDDIYKELANNPSAQAFLGPEDAEEPYLGGINYNCVAPGKRFRPMDNLSGGEKTVAALALLFSIHSYQPAPFFVLDEIDAALDNTNINKVARYIINETKEHFQCIVISLKEEFYTRAEALIGITAEPDKDCTVSQVFTLDLTQYPE
ncbi:structural maintenance of chromosomes protein 1A-like isoform X1 [Orbicella faveolata]|uniref:structural maintenance of chromosomes protein 1A-like isoform X1 n=2 Tax=Orbicella faveolata TaxID=48498 RepID=UPI0009E2D79E|nr:structural maintenance of chromosomes protein 1A-like isoform X1 [Orbicella faveolata]